MTDSQDYTQGTKIAQYTIIKKIASTHSSHVFLVQDEHLHKPLVLKLFAGDESDVAQKEQFLLQAKILVECAEIVNVAKVMHVGQGEEPNKLFMVMPFYPQNLSQLLSLHQQKLSFTSAFNIVEPLLFALEKLHSKGVLHLDIKAQNVLLDESNTPYLADFDNALVLHSSPLFNHLYYGQQNKNTSTTDEVSIASVSPLRVSAQYASPELSRYVENSLSKIHTNEQALDTASSLGIQSDLYSLGALWFRLISGQTAYSQIPNLFSIEQQELEKAIKQRLNDYAPSWAITLIARLMRNQVSERPDSAKYCLDYCHQHIDEEQDDHTIAASAIELTPRLSSLVQQIEDVLLQQGLISHDEFERLLYGYQVNNNEDGLSSTERASVGQYQTETERLQEQGLQQLIENTKHNLIEKHGLSDWFAWINYLQVMQNDNKNVLSPQRYHELLQVGRASRSDAPELATQVLSRHFEVNAKYKGLFKTYLLPLSLIALVLIFYYGKQDKNKSEPTDELVDKAASQSSVLSEHKDVVAFTDIDKKQPKQEEVQKAKSPSSTFAEQIRNTESSPVELNIDQNEDEQNNTVLGNKGVYTILPLGSSSINAIEIPWVRIREFDDIKVFSTEVSNALYGLCEEEGACRRTKQFSTAPTMDRLLQPMHPKVNVSWYDINQQFIPWINQRLDSQFSLPTFAQWQRILDSQQIKESAGLGRFSNQAFTIHCQNCRHPLAQAFANVTMPVMQGRADKNDMFHVLGNVQEWLADCWHQQSFTIDTKIESEHANRVISERCDQAPVVGLSWSDTRENLKYSLVSQRLRSAKMPNTGFRLVEKTND